MEAAERLSVKQHFDVDCVVVGGSASGLRVAALLAAGGARVQVLERRAVIGDLERSWIVTDALNPVLGYDAGPAVVHRTGVMRVHAAGRHADVPLPRADLIVERARMLPLLRARAEAAGADIRTNARVTGTVPAVGGYRVEVEGGTAPILTRHLVGADGVSSGVARALGARPNQAVPVVQARVRLPADLDPDVTHVWFQTRRTRFFYWLIPESPETAVVGLIANGAGQTRGPLDAFLVEEGFQPLEYQGAMIPLHRPLRRISWRHGRARALLVGDAAAHVKVTTVGGLVSGLWGANAAARALLDGKSYGRELRGLHAELHLHDLMRWALDRFTDADYGRLVDAIPGRLADALGSHNRDSVASAKWHILSARPGVLLLAARALLRLPRGNHEAPRGYPLALEAGD